MSRTAVATPLLLLASLPGLLWAAPDPSPSARRVAEIGHLPLREGPKPETSKAPPGTMAAHQQLTQHAPRELQDLLFERAAKLPHVLTGPSLISVKGARAFHLTETATAVREEAFMVRREFAHLHPPHDGSFHMMLPPDVVVEVIAKGWGERHPRNPRATMVFGPRTEEEAEVVWLILKASYDYALGK